MYLPRQEGFAARSVSLYYAKVNKRIAAVGAIRIVMNRRDAPRPSGSSTDNTMAMKDEGM